VACDAASSTSTKARTALEKMFARGMFGVEPPVVGSPYPFSEERAASAPESKFNFIMQDINL
jgi:hypothetical protein